MTSYKTLPVQDLADYELSRQSKTQPLDLLSPAIEIMTNYSRNAPLMLDQNMLIDDAISLLKSAHVSRTLVSNKQEEFIGAVSLAELQSARIMSIANKLAINRKELTLGNVMNPKSQFKGIQLQTILNSTIGDVLNTMEHYGLQYVLVVAKSTMEIVGMISARDISKKLQIPIQISPLPTSFEEVMLAVGHP
ncbi:CBS domain-containing protein [Neptunicella marina]|uniref:CBS domain-containing protein n=1 Tax=Neptunicella marina TaxID=2125989 RepID=A0A8J6J163_9ALTE|nr:CBS domain-containing protein [Neptunicella marina]MBC3767925.1 CBS domain-containing protein [Neptunicella marina]